MIPRARGLGFRREGAMREQREKAPRGRSELRGVRWGQSLAIPHKDTYTTRTRKIKKKYSPHFSCVLRTGRATPPAPSDFGRRLCLLLLSTLQ